MIIFTTIRAIWQRAILPVLGGFIVYVTILLVFTSGEVWAESAPFVPQSQAFSNPDTLVPMPSQWFRQPIRYPHTVHGAHLVITLDRQMHSILLPVIQQYAQKNRIKILAREGTCGTSANMLIRKQVDLASYCCPPGEFDRLPGLQFYTLGIAAIAILVHPDNPVQNLTLEQIRNIFQGRYFRWSEVHKRAGQHRRPIQTIGRLHCKLRPGHWRELLNNSDLFSPRMGEVGTVEAMLHRISSHENAIGYETLWNLTRFPGKTRLKPLAINGYLPHDDQALLAQHYPLYRVFSLAIWTGAELEKQEALKLVKHLTQVVASMDHKLGLVSAARLQKAGWKFKKAELIGEPTTVKQTK